MRKPRIFCPELTAPNYKCTNIKQIHHLAKVLRLQQEDPVEFFDGKGSLATGKIQEIGRAHINFYVDDIDLKDVAEFENKIIEKCKSDKPEIIEGIQSSGKLDEDKEKLLIEVITQLKGSFKS